MPPGRAFPLLLFLLSMAFGGDPPAIRRHGVVNAASQRPTAAGGAIARGSLISIYGVRFSRDIPPNRVTLETAGHSRALTVVRADAERLDAWIPADVRPGAARLTVTSNGLAAEPEPVVIRKAAPGLFSRNGQGWGPALADNLSGAARSPNGIANSAAPGTRLVLAVTGIMPADTPRILVGNAFARVVSIRPAVPPAYTAEITIEVPLQAFEGCYVPVYARLPGAPPSNVVTIAVHRGGGACISSPDDPSTGWQGGKTAIVLLSRTVRRTLDAPEERVEDEANAAFTDIPQDRSRTSPLLLLPPPGSCAAYAGVLSQGTAVGSSVWTLLFGGVLGQGLDAGRSIEIHNQAGQLRVPFVSGAPGLYRRTLPGAPRPSPQTHISFDAGRIGISGSGGGQVGPFAVALPAPEAFTGGLPPGPIDRSRELTVEWKAANSEGSLVIVLVGIDRNLNVAGLTYCNAPKAAGRFTIPAELLAQLPPGTGDLVMASWTVRIVNPPPSGIWRMMALSVFARSSEATIE